MDCPPKKWPLHKGGRCGEVMAPNDREYNSQPIKNSIV